MAKIKITQVKSSIGKTARQIKTLEALGLRRINHTVEHEDVATVKGMVSIVNHLVKVEQA